LSRLATDALLLLQVPLPVALLKVTVAPLQIAIGSLMMAGTIRTFTTVVARQLAQ
jgi:hypothetical protein